MKASLERLRRRREEEGDEGGFTLIELLIVIVILGILAAIVVFAVQNLTGSSSQASCGSDFKTVQTAMEAYKAQVGAYPSGGGTAAGTVTIGTTPATTFTDDDATTLNAALNPTGPQSELLTGTNANGAAQTDSTGLATPNLAVGPGASPVGPWLKSIPKNAGHYSIFAANDGSGNIQVLNAAGTPVGAANDPAACNSL